MKITNLVLIILIANIFPKILVGNPIENMRKRINESINEILQNNLTN